MLRKQYVFMLFLFIIGHLLFSQEIPIPIFTYHTHAPFIISENVGLTYDLAEYLTYHSDGKYRFTPIPMSRSRVNKLLEQNETGIVPWVNPAWFQDLEEIKFNWTKGMIMNDSNAVISHIDLHLEYEEPGIIKNYRLGGIRGHHYVGIDSLVDSGQIRRYDAENHLDNFRKILKGRVDVTIMPKSGAEYLIMKYNMGDDLYISQKPHSTYKRRIIICNDDIDLTIFLDYILDFKDTDPEWSRIVRKYSYIE